MKTVGFFRLIGPFMLLQTPFFANVTEKYVIHRLISAASS